MSPDYSPSRSFLLDLYSRMPTRTKNPSIVEYAETTIVPSGKYRGMKFSHNRAPFLKEPLSLLSPDSPFQDVAMMTPAQIGKSTLAELVTMYYITQVPSEILYVSSNETAAVKWMERRIVPRAEAAGVQFRTEVESRTSRKTGDTSYSKLFPGGNIDIASALSPAQLASETKRVTLGDECDRWRVTLGDEGSVIDMIKARTQAWGSQAKRLWISTPTIEDVSLIWQMVQTGDMREYFVACPHCGKMQTLDFLTGKGYGLTWERKDGHIYRKSIELICEGCGKGIRESSKNTLLNSGEWRASCLPSTDFIASFMLNGLYSPLLSWYDMAIAYEESLTGPVKKQAFENLKMGRPYRETGTRPKVEKIIENRGTYKSGTVPDGVLYLTMGIDVQRGSENNENNNARIEAQIIGVGAGYRTWVIDYIVFDGDITDPYGGAWEKLNQFGLDTELTFYRSDGFGFPVSVVFIDSGDGSASDIVYRFCSRWQNTYPIKGRAEITRRKKDAPDEVIQGNMQRYRASKLDEDTLIYLVNTNFFKARIYHGLKIERQEGDIQRPGFIDFPKELDEKYFNGLTAEERKRDGSFHNPGGRRNEPLDTMVYALCAADVFLDSEVINYRMWAQQNGANKADLQKITHKTVLENMTVSTARKKVEKNK
jgi:phage terminase large subunit GpA-like protein